jgi:hypothetical protein
MASGHGLGKLLRWSAHAAESWGKTQVADLPVQLNWLAVHKWLQ